MSVIGADDLRVTHPCASGIATPRLACVRHAASVRPEPGSNSQKIIRPKPSRGLFTCVVSAFLTRARTGPPNSLTEISLIPPRFSENNSSFAHPLHQALD